MATKSNFATNQTDMSREWINHITAERSRAWPTLVKLFKSLCE